MVCRPGHENDPLERMRHSCAHVMASAVKEILGGRVKVAIGPVIEDGYFYDFDYDHPFTPEVLEKIEKKMKEIVGRNLPFKREVMSRKDALKKFRDLDESYKCEIIAEIPEGEEISCYTHGNFTDLCKGPHVESTSEIKAFKLLSVAGAYWRGNEKNKMLQRIYGTAFSDEKSLQDFLHRLKEAEARDHRRIGRELDLFSTLEADGAGLILWHPMGARVRKVIEDYWREEHVRRGYHLVYTPHVARQDVWKTSGHLDFYRDYMYSPMEMEGISYRLKPMNCPFHLKIFASHLKSYRELPVRLAELGTVYRFERSGVLHGLFRVRGFTQDDAHLFLRPDQLQDEVIRVLDFTFSMMKAFGFEEYEVFLSTKPARSVGSDENWEHATMALRQALEAKGITYEIDPGEGVFYGPKIDLKIKDVLGRSWQCSTIQVDFNLPERFDLHYVAADGSRQRPIMVHRALLGSIERFFGILIEHYAGAFPVWLAPVQVILLSVSEKVEAYAREVNQKMEERGVRVELDVRGEKLGQKIREAELKKIPYMIVIGEKEREKGTISVRSKKRGDLGSLSPKDFLEQLVNEIVSKT